MSMRSKTQAQICAAHMRAAGVTPASIVSVGVGCAPEYSVWVNTYPSAQLLGIDPRGRRRWGDSRFIKAAVTDGSQKEVVWCGCCRSICCDRSLPHKKNRDHVVPCVTLDEVCAEMPGPVFLWLDCEGSELPALRGGPRTLRRTPFLSLEMTRNVPALRAFLEDAGYECVSHSRLDLEDRLYRRVLPCEG